MPWTHIASAIAQSTSAPIINSAGANFLVAVIRYYGASSGFRNIGSGTANVWTLVGTTQDFSGQKVDVYYCDNPAYTGANTGVAGDIGYFACSLAAFNRPAGTLSVSAKTVAQATGSTLATGSFTPAANDALIITWQSHNGDVGAPSAAPSGFSSGGLIASSNSAGYGGGLAYLNQATAAAVNPSWTIPASADMLVGGVSFTVAGAGTAPSITTQPSNQTVTQPATASFSATYTGTITGYQAQVSTDGGSSWSNVTDGTGGSGGAGTGGALNYTTTATAVSSGNHRNAYRYRFRLSHAGGTVDSAAAVLTVNAPPLAVTLDAITDEAGNPRASYTVDKIWAIRISDNTLVATWTGQSTNGAGVLPALSSAALTAVPHEFVTYTATGLRSGAKVYTPS